MNEKIYGYIRISSPRQNILRQERNILNEYPSAIIIKEIYTGTKIEGRKEFIKLINLVKNDILKGYKSTIVFDSVSRFARNEEEGYHLYMDLFNNGVKLVFLKEPQINTETYNKALNTNDINLTGTNADILLSAVKEYLMEIAKEQIRIAFQQSEKEVKDLRQRTSEGLLTAKLNGKQIGRVKGKKYITNKEKRSKELILKNSKDFNGSNSDIEVMKICSLSRNTYYKYKNELKNKE